MKRTLLIIIFALSAVLAFAKPPKLNVEKLFDGRYNKDKSVTTSVYVNNGNYFRGLTVTNNPKILNAIGDAIEKDRPRGKDFFDQQDNSGRFTSLKVVNNGVTIYIGLQRDNKGGGFFFIQGKENAFR